jgi:predicted GNAT family N-acyltransferase
MEMKKTSHSEMQTVITHRTHLEFENHLCEAATKVWNTAFGCRDVDEWSATTNDYVVVVYKNTVAVAAATLSIKPFPLSVKQTPNETMAVGVESFAANPKNSGYGTVLMNAIIGFAHAKHIAAPIYLHMDENDGMQRISRFYARFGFVIDTDFMCFTSAGGVAMRLYLQDFAATIQSTPY